VRILLGGVASPAAIFVVPAERTMPSGEGTHRTGCGGAPLPGEGSGPGALRLILSGRYLLSFGVSALTCSLRLLAGDFAPKCR